MDLSNRGIFGSKFGIIAAASGSAIGLGNIWRFPYMAGKNGGAAFLLIYIFFVLAIGIPVMLSEFIIGRSTQRNPYDAFKKLKPGSPWFIIGIMGILAAFMILAFYGTVAGWTLEYLYQSVINGFKGKTAGEINQMFVTFNSQTLRPVLWQVIFMVLTASIVLGGVEKGIEKYSKILMPLLVVIIIILDIRAITLPGAREGIAFSHLASVWVL
jgi:NSS family neurotransmitter:Na+ symporter